MTGLDGYEARVGDERLVRIYRAVAAHEVGSTPTDRLEAICRAAIAALGVSGVGVMLMAERAHQGTMFASDGRIGELENLQNAAAEGPCIDSYNLGRPIFAPDLAADGVPWPLLAATALRAGIRALFSFPLQLDDTCIGALDLYRERPGPLSGEEIDDGRLLAAMATREVLAIAEGAGASLPGQVADLSGDRAAIEQATGMVAAQSDTTVAHAATRLRQAAAEQSRSLAEVAHDVVSRLLRFE